MFIGDLIGMTFDSIEEMIALIEKEFVYPVTDCGDSLIGINDGEEYGGECQDSSGLVLVGNE